MQGGPCLALLTPRLHLQCLGDVGSRLQAREEPHRARQPQGTVSQEDVWSDLGLGRADPRLSTQIACYEAGFHINVAQTVYMVSKNHCWAVVAAELSGGPGWVMAPGEEAVTTHAPGCHAPCSGFEAGPCPLAGRAVVITGEVVHSLAGFLSLDRDALVLLCTFRSCAPVRTLTSLGALTPCLSCA